MKNRALLLGCLFLFLSKYTAQLYTFKNYNYKEGLNFSEITTATQSSDGLIWLGTPNSGLLQFNGKKFKEIYFSKADNKHCVTSILESKTGEIYFSSLYKGIYKILPNGYELIYKNSRHVNKYLGIYAVGNYLLIVCDKSILIQENGKIIAEKAILTDGGGIKITQSITTPFGLVILTNQGSYAISIQEHSIQSLADYFKLSKEETINLRYGYCFAKKIVLFSGKLDQKLEIKVTDSGEIIKKRKQFLQSPLTEKDQVSTANFNSQEGKLVLVSKFGELIEYQNERFKIALSNCSEKPVNCQFNFGDRYGDNWLCSSFKGLYKVSNEPFTKVELDPIFQNTLITFCFKSSLGDFFLSTEGDQTYIRPSKHGSFKMINIASYSACEFKKVVYVGTSEGLKRFDPNTKKLLDIQIPEANNKKVQFVFSDDEAIWIGIENGGIIRFNPLTQEKRICQNLYSGFPTNFYTAQKSYDGTYILFGSNSGIHQFNLKSKTFYHVNDIPAKLGETAILSTIDEYGTRWFTLEKGLIGVTKSNKKRIIQDRKNLISTDFRTLNSDKLGNLILGTNKGITILSLNKYGDVLESKIYNGQSGFTGYETRKRVQFQSKNNIYLGTVEGLYLVNTMLFKTIKSPSKPMIKSLQLKSDQLENSYPSGFSVSVNNAKIGNLLYSYRIVGYDDDWSPLTTDTLIFLNDLPKGEYTFQVKTSFNEINFSEPSSLTFQVDKPFWSSNFFIVFLILAVLAFNIYFLNKIKFFDTSTIFSNKDNTITTTLIPRIILVGNGINTIAHIIGHELDKTIPFFPVVSLISCMVLIFLYFVARNTAKLNQQRTTKRILIASLSFILIDNFIEIYLSNLHFYPIIIIAIISILIPFVFEKLRSSIIYSISTLVVGSVCFITLENTEFNKYLFLVMLILIVCSSIFTTYLRHDSISKLLFISGVVNKGDVLAIAINGEDKIIYVSENISEFINTSHSELIDKNILVLDSFLPKNNETTIFSKEIFENGQKQLAPMVSVKGNVIWIEWSCKVFSEDVKVILGQDITRKMELETTFELLVQNAEDFIYQCDAKGNFIFVNDHTATIIEYGKDELIGMNFSQIIEEQFRSTVVNHYQEHFTNRNNTSYFEFPVVTKSKAIIWVGQHVTTLYEPASKDRIKGFLAVARDITDSRQQQRIIEEQQNDITSSIHYAKRIQLNLLPSHEQFAKSFHDSFIVYKPKDIVSGDFYWMERVIEYTIFALGDCTGHGVPGSFMTLLGINLLNSIVLEGNLINPGKILTELDKKLVHVLPRGQGDSKINDGMEITVCVFNHLTNQLTYSCAGSRFLICREGVLEVLKGDSKHIGDYSQDIQFEYTTRSLNVGATDILYFFSDGFQDQFGGQRNKKFNFRQIKQLIENNNETSLPNQKNILEKELSDWIGDYPQTDDITIIGLKGLRPLH